MGRKAGEDKREYKAAAGHISNGYHCIVFKGGSKESFCLSWHPCPKGESSQLSHLCEQIRTSTLASSRTTLRTAMAFVQGRSCDGGDRAGGGVVIATVTVMADDGGRGGGGGDDHVDTDDV